MTAKNDPKTPAQVAEDKHLAKLATAQNKLNVARKAEADSLREVHELIREGFSKQISGLKLAHNSGLSLPRVYQIRDEKAKR